MSMAHGPRGDIRFHVSCSSEAMIALLPGRCLHYSYDARYASAWRASGFRCLTEHDAPGLEDALQMSHASARRCCRPWWRGRPRCSREEGKKKGLRLPTPIPSGKRGPCYHSTRGFAAPTVYVLAGVGGDEPLFHAWCNGPTPSSPSLLPPFANRAWTESSKLPRSARLGLPWLALIWAWRHWFGYSPGISFTDSLSTMSTQRAFFYFDFGRSKDSSSTAASALEC